MSPGEGNGRPVVLVVDDEEHHRLLYREELEDAGYEVVLAGSGPEAVEIASRQHIDIVVLDIAMPGMDGIETMSRLFNINRCLPVVIHTAYSDFRDDFTTWAADAYVIKSSDLTGLLATLRDVLGRRGLPLPRPTPATTQ